jgi:hypothetical protein
MGSRRDWQREIPPWDSPCERHFGNFEHYTKLMVVALFQIKK